MRTEYIHSDDNDLTIHKVMGLWGIWFEEKTYDYY